MTEFVCQMMDAGHTPKKKKEKQKTNMNQKKESQEDERRMKEG